jgi:hypothetical protein
VTGALATATFVVAAFSGWQVREARRAADQQHTDTLAALNKTDSSIEATNRLGDAAARSNVEAHRLADEAKRSADNGIETAERQLRAYVGVVDDIILKCPLCETVEIDKPLKIEKTHIFDNILTLNIQNSGVTPAYNLWIEVSWWQGNYGGKLPNGFAGSSLTHMGKASSSLPAIR